MTLTRNEKAGWLRSLATVLSVFCFLLALHKAQTPALGALLGILFTATALGSIRLINHWQLRSSAPHTRQTLSPATGKQD